jgi:hypothetical protein
MANETIVLYIPACRAQSGRDCFLTFSCYFFCIKTKEVNTIFKIFLTVLFLLKIRTYFLCLDAKKVTKKNQGKPERSARFALPTPHLTLRKMYFVLEEDK